MKEKLAVPVCARSSRKIINHLKMSPDVMTPSGVKNIENSLNRSCEVISGDFSAHRPIEYKVFEQEVMASSTPITKYDDVSSASEGEEEKLNNVDVSIHSEDFNESMEEEDLNTTTNYDSIDENVKKTDVEYNQLLKKFVIDNKRYLKEHKLQRLVLVKKISGYEQRRLRAIESLKKVEANMVLANKILTSVLITQPE
uniref:Uncharacterized protein LOC114347160 n=1 Tax=Diabrotica virgifera virgifera TaxID=50390 RepID=A0A6P7GW11_DIAVI